MRSILERAPLVLATCLAVGCDRSPHASVGDAASASSTADAVAPQVITVPAPADVAGPPSDAITTSSGIAMKVLKAGQDTEHPIGDDCMRVRFTGWTRDGALVSTSQHQSEGVTQCVRQVVPGVSEALQAMTVGEERRVWIPGPLTVNARDKEQKGPSPDLTFDLELLAILKAPTPPADLRPPKGATKTPSGLSFRVLTKGTGKVHPSDSSRVTLHMSGWKADGSLIETTLIANHPTEYPVSELVAGLREGLGHMVVGEKARFWIPAALAYGDKPGRRGVPIGDLIYEIELLALE